VDVENLIVKVNDMTTWRELVDVLDKKQV